MSDKANPVKENSRRQIGLSQLCKIAFLLMSPLRARFIPKLPPGIYMKEFLQKFSFFVSMSDHPACIALSERLSEVDLSSETNRSATQHSKPPVCGHLSEVFSSTNAIELCKNLGVISEQLVWWEAPRGKISSFMDDNHAILEIIGPDANFVSV